MFVIIFSVIWLHPLSDFGMWTDSLEITHSIYHNSMKTWISEKEMRIWIMWWWWRRRRIHRIYHVLCTRIHILYPSGDTVSVKILPYFSRGDDSLRKSN